MRISRAEPVPAQWQRKFPRFFEVFILGIGIAKVFQNPVDSDASLGKFVGSTPELTKDTL
ncbi:MAG TPA: hypothetical protein VFF11_04465 [Candidatus Binatia bacterium]|nr:hypothetical protein [Candidatus Binatia bacterium]